jgi:glycerophosphoryl diester phosphodiesterase
MAPEMAPPSPTLPRMAARFAFLDHPGPIPLAHRGGAAEGPENTLTSFSHALSLGFRYIETDVNATSDGVVAVIHDPFLDRVSDRTGLVGSLPWSEVSAAVLGDGGGIQRLDELLERWPDVRWNIDAKSDDVVDPLIEVIRRAGAVERVCVTSFSDRRVARARTALGPRLCTGMGPRSLLALRVDGYLPACTPRRVDLTAHGAAQVPVRLGAMTVIDRRFVAGAHRAGLAVHAWTIDSISGMERLLDLGVDRIISDRPTLLRRVLEGRGLWA